VPELACPACRGALAAGDDAVRCAGCGATYPLREGIPVFASGDPFYDAYVEEHVPFSPSPPGWKAAILAVLPYWSWREWRFFRRHVPPGARVLDIGCGRGKAWFTGEGRVVAGVDPCWPVLPECAGHYDVVAQASIVALPFADDSFDCAVTSHVLGHVPADEKGPALSEVARVLAPGGCFVSIVETDSSHPRVLWAKRDADLYRRNFVETDGHVGLEPAPEVIRRLAAHGLHVTDVRCMESGVLHLRMYPKYFGVGYPALDPAIGRRIRAWRRLTRSRVAMGAYEVVMGAYHHLVEQRTRPLDHAMFIAVRAEKRPGVTPPHAARP
jgi:SAM-dependent methyltransferase